MTPITMLNNIHDNNGYAFCGTKKDWSNTLSALAEMAENEEWSFDEDHPYSVLHNYINATFKRCYDQNKILETTYKDKRYSCFNTGLLTKNGDDIIALCKANHKPGVQPWILIGFKSKNDRLFMSIFSSVPKLATYTENYEELYFNPNYSLELNTDHILDDNWDRINKVIPLSKTVVHSLMTGAIEETKKKISRNMRLVVPQFYNNQIMYLIPIRLPIDDENSETMALAVELTETKQYRANTILTKEMAYEKARLLMKPENNWLI